MDSLDDSALTSSQKDDLMEKIKQEIALANFQEFLSKLTDKCFKLCIQKPGTSLDNSEQKCVAMCMDRYFDCHSVVLKAYTNRIQRERTEK